MKIVTYKCDYCGKEETIEYGSGYTESQRLWVVGYYDACIECSVKAGEYLVSLLDEKNGKEKIK